MDSEIATRGKGGGASVSILILIAAPKKGVGNYVKSFFESTIDGHLSNATPPVPNEKIRSAMVREG